MNYILTAFDRTKTAKPLVSLVFNSETKSVDLLDLYLQGTGSSIKNAIDNSKYIASLFDGEVVVNDFKSHVEAFNLPIDRDYKAYTIPEEEDINIPQDKPGLYKYLATKLAGARKINTNKWQLLMSDAMLVYLTLQRRGVRRGGVMFHPIYNLTTFTGRSKTTEFSIQGMGDNEEITHVDEDKIVFVCADWISADMRALSLLSEDPDMQKSFVTADPYKYIVEKTGRDRDSCKIELLKSIYSLNPNSPALDVFPKLKRWIVDSVDKMRHDGYLTSILNRKFYLSSERDERAVFNAPIQGTVAHAMHNAMIQINRKLPQHLLTELHDSIIVCCTKSETKTVIETVQDIMLHPFRDILPSNPTFPLKVSIGGSWRQWKQLREIR